MAGDRRGVRDFACAGGACGAAVSLRLQPPRPSAYSVRKTTLWQDFTERMIACSSRLELELRWRDECETLERMPEGWPELAEELYNQLWDEMD